MTELASRVDAFAARCPPDFIYPPQDVDSMQFVVVDLLEMLEDDSPPQVGVIFRGEEAHTHILNPWSRQQLLSTVGTREKWFEPVSRLQEAEELNRRRTALRGYKFRAVSTDYPLRILRGMVSSSYSDIPDTEVMKTLVDLMPEGQALRRLSGQTDRALYVHAVHGTPLGLPGSAPVGFPGVVVKNSEVGYTSLWVIPAFYAIGSLYPVVFEKRAVLRRIHRGNIKSMHESLDAAMKEVSAVWGDIAQRAAALEAKIYANSDTAVVVMKNAIAAAGGSKNLALNAERHYLAQPHTRHTGGSILASILHAANVEDVDDTYTQSTIAGSVLWALSQ